MDKKKKTYTAIDFARYHSGNMEAKEMHALEKAALEDPFLSDALEGYMHTESASEDVQHLKSMLAEKTKSKKLYSIASVSQNVWWRIAAIFVLIGIAGYFFFNMGIEQGRSIAKNEAEQMKQQVNQLPAYDSPAIAMSLQNEKKNEGPLASGSVENSLPEPGERKSKNVPEKKEAKQKRPQELTVNTPAQTRRNFSVQRQLEDTTVSKGGIARIASNDHQRVLEEKLVLSNLNKEDSNNIAISSLLYADTSVIAFQSKAANTGSINKKNSELSELDAVEKAKKTKLTQNTQTNIRGKISDIEITLQSPLQPIEGIANYYKYINNSKQKVIDSNNITLQGIVQLEFFIDKEGKPINIRVLKSDCPQCEKQAISLLKNGPWWKGKLNQSGEVIIRF